MTPSADGALNPLFPAVPMESEPVSLALFDLTTGLARGDDGAWGAFHRDYGPALFRRLLAAAGGDHDLAGEALQQAYLRIARHARPCASEAQFGAWLRTVGRSALSDCRRRRLSFWRLRWRREAEADPGAEDAGAERLAVALDAALAGLDADERALLEAKYFIGRDVRALADALGLSPKAVESRLTRARAELRRRFLRELARHE